MNKKLAIFGFVIIWIAALFAIGFIMLPKLFSDNDVPTIERTSGNTNQADTIDTVLENDDSFFYDKKVFVRHRKNDDDTIGNINQETEKIILVRKNIFFKPLVKPKPAVKPAPRKQDNSDFDIKPVPTN